MYDSFVRAGDPSSEQSERDRLMAELLDLNQAIRSVRQQPQRHTVGKGVNSPRPTANRPRVAITAPAFILILVIIWLGILGGWKTVSTVFDTPAPTITYQTATPAAIGLKPTLPAVAAPIVPVVAPAVLPPTIPDTNLGAGPVVPPSEIVATPAVPAAVVPTTARVVVNEGAEVVPPAAVVTAICTEATATYTVYRTITSGGQPIRRLTGFSCISLADAETKADTQERALRATLLQHATVISLDPPPPTPGMGPGGGGGGDW